MGDVVASKHNQEEKEIEQRVMRYQLDKEDRDKKEEDRRKFMMRKKNLDIKKTLDIQMEEKKLAKQHENAVN